MCLGWQHNNQGSLTTNNQQSQPIPSGCLRTSSARDLYPEDPIFSPDPILHRGSRKTSFYFGHFKFSLRNKNLDPWQFYVFVDLSTSSSLNNLSDSPLNNLSTGASLRSSSMAKASFICGADSPVRLASLATALVRHGGDAGSVGCISSSKRHVICGLTANHHTIAGNDVWCHLRSVPAPCLMHPRSPECQRLVLVLESWTWKIYENLKD